MSEYFDILDSIPPSILIAGKDRYPNNAIDIPFCKETLDQLGADNCSGKHLLKGLGFEIEDFPNVNNPREIFHLLAQEHSIGFINAIQESARGYIRKSSHQVQLQATLQRYSNLFVSANKIILLGEAEKLRWGGLNIEADNIYKHIHSDVRNRVNPKIREKWYQLYGNKRGLLNSIGLQL